MLKAICKAHEQTPTIAGTTIGLMLAKLLGLLDWPWWQVLSPVWVTGSLMILMIEAVYFYRMVSGRNPKKSKQ